MAERTASVRRETLETVVAVELALDGGEVAVSTGVGFFDHMLTCLGRHAGFGLHVTARGDLEVDAHHTVEDCALAIGQALAQAVGDKAGLARFGDAVVPLDETLVLAAVDLSGRPYCSHVEPALPPRIGDSYDTTLTGHVFSSLAAAGALTLHVRVLAGQDAHHVVEAQFKAVARALRQAVAVGQPGGPVPSTKGVL